MLKRTSVPILTLLLLIGWYVIGNSLDQTHNAADDKPTVKLAYVEWSSEVASTNVVRAVLQEKLGYNVKLTPVGAAAMWQAVAIGDQDAHVCAWLPTTHDQYLEKFAEGLEDLGPNLIGTRVGLVVPQYMDVATIADLKLDSVAEKLNATITGIDPGAGLMGATEKVLKEYELSPQYELVAGSGASMTGALANALDTEQWIVVTGWTPHWMFSRWKLKYLQDPRNVYGGEEKIHSIARKGLKDDLPDVYAFLDRFNWTTEQMQQVMSWNTDDDADPYVNAVRWINENPHIVDQWLGQDSESDSE